MLLCRSSLPLFPLPSLGAVCSEQIVLFEAGGLCPNILMMGAPKACRCYLAESRVDVIKSPLIDDYGCPGLLPGFPDSSAGKESACNAGDSSSIPGSGRSAGDGNRYPLQYSGLENSMCYIVHGVTKSQHKVSNFHFHFSGLLPQLQPAEKHEGKPWGPSEGGHGLASDEQSQQQDTWPLSRGGMESKEEAGREDTS